MPETETREALQRAVVDEPDFSYDLDVIVARGRAGRRRHRARLGSLAAVGVCAVAGAAFVLTPGLLAERSPSRTAAPAGTGGSTTAPAVNEPSTVRPPAAVPVRPTNALDRAMAAAVISASPEDWFLDLPSSDSSPGGLDGTADDGDGPGRIYVWTSTSTQQVHPCTDGEFRAGGTCDEQTLASGAVLSKRGPVRADNGVETIMVVLTYPNGSGVGAESGNFSLGPLPKVITSGADKPQPEVNRAHPTYSIAQLTAVVRAVDAALS